MFEHRRLRIKAKRLIFIGAPDGAKLSKTHHITIALRLGLAVKVIGAVPSLATSGR